MHIFILILALVVSCGKNPSKALEKQIYYSYGNDPLPNSLTPLDQNYSPKDLSSKTFLQNGKTYTPINIATQNLKFDIDVSAQTIIGTSFITFTVAEKGFPYFDLIANIQEMNLDIAPVSFESIADPTNMNQSFVTLNQEVEPGQTYILKAIYEINHNYLGFANGGVQLQTQYTDLNGKFFEYWGPVAFEDDQFQLNLDFNLINSTVSHNLFVNGNVDYDNAFLWKVTFPQYYTKSSFYFHFTSTSYVVRNFSYQGLERSIPITAYGASAAIVNEAIETLPMLLKEFEDDYGPYPHSEFLANMKSSGGGMEYVGATITSLGSLDHELLHSWFARGVMPAEGRSGWIDEAFASWRDYNYFQAPSLLERSITNLANYSPFQKTTPRNSYVEGRHLISELDRKFANYGGMKFIMRKFFERYKYQVVTTEELKAFLEKTTDTNLDAYFDRYAFGK